MHHLHSNVHNTPPGPSAVEPPKSKLVNAMVLNEVYSPPEIVRVGGLDRLQRENLGTELDCT